MPSDNVRRIDPRPVLVLHDGVWVEAIQDAWVRWPDGDWRASVSFRVAYEWGVGRHVMSVTADRVQLVE